MNRMLGKIHSLLQPCVEEGEFRLGPLPAEVRAAAALMQWMADELPTSRILLQSEAKAHHRSWPNVKEWQSFMKAIDGLTVEIGLGAERGDADARKSDFGAVTEDVDAMQGEAEAMSAATATFDHARSQLLKECRLMMEVSPGANAPTKASERRFLPSDSQRQVYRELVQDYYREFIVGKELKHKDLMVHWAAVYDAIVNRTGLRDCPFLGPEFDAFLYDFCGIAYNESSTRRGRYRTIQDLRARFLELRHECPMYQDFMDYRNEMTKIISRQHRVVGRSGSDVPRKLFSD